MAKATPTKAAAKKPRAKGKLQKVQIAPAAKAVKKTDKPAKVSCPIKSDSSKKSRNGTPKGKGTRVGRNGNGRIGNPPFVPTAEQKKIVETHAACGTLQWLIASEIGVSEPTLREHFRYELDTGLLRLNARIGSIIAKQALSGCRSSQNLWMKTRGGWGEKTALVLTGPGGGAVELAAVPRNPDLKKLSIEELKTLRRLEAKLEGLPDASDD